MESILQKRRVICANAYTHTRSASLQSRDYQDTGKGQGKRPAFPNAPLPIQLGEECIFVIKTSCGAHSAFHNSKVTSPAFQKC
jgi:hypothetical protein